MSMEEFVMSQTGHIGVLFSFQSISILETGKNLQEPHLESIGWFILLAKMRLIYSKHLHEISF